VSHEMVMSPFATASDQELEYWQSSHWWSKQGFVSLFGKVWTNQSIECTLDSNLFYFAI
jgi:hypothetical protein